MSEISPVYCIPSHPRHAGGHTGPLRRLFRYSELAFKSLPNKILCFHSFLNSSVLLSRFFSPPNHKYSVRNRNGDHKLIYRVHYRESSTITGEDRTICQAPRALRWTTTPLVPVVLVPRSDANRAVPHKGPLHSSALSYGRVESKGHAGPQCLRRKLHAWRNVVVSSVMVTKL